MVLVDTRNDYEVEIGTFKSLTQTSTFREFHAEPRPRTQGKTKVAMFCTGGIRCEGLELSEAPGWKKSTILGGILKYLEEVPEAGVCGNECFVFDGRVSVDHSLEPVNMLCYGW